MPPKTIPMTNNKRKLDSTEDDNDQPTKKINLDPSEADMVILSDEPAIATEASKTADVSDESNQMEIIPTAQNNNNNNADDDNEPIQIQPKYRETIQKEIKRMAGVDYSTTFIQEGVWLPPEVMINIMLSLSRTTVAIMTRVCKV
jgi:hypothetical protein